MINGHGTWDFVASIIRLSMEIKPKHFLHLSLYMLNGKKQLKTDLFHSATFTVETNMVKRFSILVALLDGIMLNLLKRDSPHGRYDTDKKTYKVEFVDNKLAPSFEAISVKSLFEGKDLSKLSLEEVSLALTLVTEQYDNVRIDLSGLSEEKIKILKKTLSENPKS